jgi:hypothetical protein
MKKRHNPEQIVRKLREADALLSGGATIAACIRLEVSEVADTAFVCNDPPPWHTTDCKWDRARISVKTPAFGAPPLILIFVKQHL